MPLLMKLGIVKLVSMQIRAKVNEMLQCGTGETDEAFGAQTGSSAFSELHFNMKKNHLFIVFSTIVIMF